MTAINLGLFSVGDKTLVQSIIATAGLDIEIDDAPVDVHGKPVLFSIRAIAHSPASTLWPFWKAYHLARPARIRVRRTFAAYETDACAHCGDPILAAAIRIANIDGQPVTLCPICYDDGPDDGNPAAVRY